jgi:Tol biopolymer transport system component/tRNA A-37 threonylcarbamoyl transferase component Bud32
VNPERLRQIEEMYHLAREREPGERTDFLAEACKDDEDLRREVESLLAANRSGGCFLDQPVMLKAAGILASQQSGSEYRLATGLELGPYVIEARLGSGGMGEVYRARDKRLHRTVALKVLPQRLADTPGLRQRLEREAKAISSLNHPQICTLYDIGREGEVDYLVMELLEGETLAQRLKRGALPLPDVLKLAVQIASALAAAHAAGIVHRDLKPGNIMLTKSGAKLLDFGLAKMRAAEGVAGAAAGSLAEPITTVGTLIGTAQYMSPEQIQGHEADARSDLFALGATLYEMVTGQRAFAGASQFAVVNAILEKDPVPVRSLQPLTPPALERVVGRCLAKDPEYRWQNTSDLASELRWIAEAGGTPVAGASSEALAKGRIREWLYAAMAVIFFIAAMVSAVSYRRLTHTSPPAIAAEIAPPRKMLFKPAAFGGEPSLSPDGRVLVFCASDESGKTILWIRPLNSLAARPLPGTEGASHPFWSPNGRTVGFFAGNQLKTIEAEGGPTVAIAASTIDEGGGTWNRDGTILFIPDAGEGVYAVAAAGGKPVRVIAADSHKPGLFAHPRFLPDGKHFLFYLLEKRNNPALTGTYFASLDGRDKRLVYGNTPAIYAAGFMLYLRQDTLMAEAFDPQRGRLKGEPPHSVAEGVAPNYFHNNFDASEGGNLVYRGNGDANEKRLTWFDRAGKNLGFTGEAADYWDVRLSPDGHKLASNIGTPNSEIWIDDLARGVRMRLTIDPENDHGDPVWSPNGNQIVFGMFDKGIYKKNYNGAGDEKLLLSDPKKSIWPTSCSGDGRFILYSRSGPHQADTDIWVLPLAGDRRPRPFVQANGRAYGGQFSPDDRWVAYTSEESGRSQVYVVPFTGGTVLNAAVPAGASAGARWQVSASGGSSPKWRRDGKEIFYLSPEGQMMAAEVEERGDSMVVKTAAALFRCRPAPTVPSSAPYDVSADGKKFVINSFGEDAPLILLVNWTAGLK